jgi:hypothetical protein
MLASRLVSARGCLIRWKLSNLSCVRAQQSAASDEPTSVLRHHVVQRVRYRSRVVARNK